MINDVSQFRRHLLKAAKTSRFPTLLASPPGVLASLLK